MVNEKQGLQVTQEVKLRQWIREEVRRVLEGSPHISVPTRPAPTSDDANRKAGQHWQDSRYDKPHAAKDKSGQTRRYKTQQGAQQHAQQ